MKIEPPNKGYNIGNRVGANSPDAMRAKMLALQAIGANTLQPHGTGLISAEAERRGFLSTTSLSCARS